MYDYKVKIKIWKIEHLRGEVFIQDILTIIRYLKMV